MEDQRDREGESEAPESAPTAPPSATPLSMPPFLDLPRPLAFEASAPETGDAFGTGPSAEPDSTLPLVNLGHAFSPEGSGAPPPPTMSGAWYEIASPAPTPRTLEPRRRRNIAVFLIAVIAAAGLGVAAGVSIGSRSPGSLPSSLGSVPSNSPSPFKSTSSVNAIAAALTPSVVDIDTSVDEPGGIGEAAGSGMILTSSGQVLTNNHVIEDATRISVTISGRAHPFGATVVGVDTIHDVALLQLSGVTGLAHVDVGNSSNLSVGDDVVAIGNALGQGGAPAATGGSVSALGQSIMADSEVTRAREDLRGLIETNAQIQPGDSGGPLVNTFGQVVGMDTAAASSAGGPAVGFAIPINQAIDIAKNIEKGVAGNGIVIGPSAFMGVFVEPVPAYRAGQGSFGAPCGAGPSSGSTSKLPSAGEVVVKVVCGGPAVAAGIAPGDTIVAVDGSAVTNNEKSLSVILAHLKPGESARVKIVSESGATSTLREPLGAQPT